MSNKRNSQKHRHIYHDELLILISDNQNVFQREEYIDKLLGEKRVIIANLTLSGGELHLICDKAHLLLNEIDRLIF